MKWFKNLKISRKLILSFLVVALIAGVIGVLGYIGIVNVELEVEEIGHVRLPSVESLLIISEGQTAVRLEEKTLLDGSLSLDERKESYQNIETIRERIQHAWDIYAPLPQSEEEAIEWQKFLGLWDTWSKDVDIFLEMSRERDVASEEEGEAILIKMRERSVNENTTEFFEAEESLLKLIKINDEISEASVVKAVNTVNRSLTVLLSVIVFGLALAILLAIIIARMISKPVNAMLSAANAIAEGNLDFKLDIETKDEVGMLGRAFKKMTQKINMVMSNINNASEQVASGASQLSDSSMSLSQGATEQASSIERLTASVEEISIQTKANAENAEQARDMAKNAYKYAEEGNHHMVDMLGAMSDINESSTNISKIIKVIDDIAFQTNILALNAAVEAARAGQHGKGFAVVAEEVRNLAARSANAAKETTTMIEGSIEKVEGGTRIANETAQALNQIVEGVSKATELVGEIAIASTEQALGVEQINQGLSQISSVVQTTSATAEQTAAASQELSGQAGMLKSQVKNFTLKKQKIETMTSEVAKMLKNMGSNQRSNEAQRISLSDLEFEKY